MIQRARAIPGEARELRLPDRHLACAAARDEERKLHVLSRDDDAVVCQRVDAQAAGNDDRLLELALFLPQPEFDLELPCLVDRHRAKLRAQHADRMQSSHERSHRAVVIAGVETLLRSTDVRGNRREAVDEFLRRPRTLP